MSEELLIALVKIAINQEYPIPRTKTVQRIGGPARRIDEKFATYGYEIRDDFYILTRTKDQILTGLIRLVPIEPPNGRTYLNYDEVIALMTSAKSICKNALELMGVHSMLRHRGYEIDPMMMNATSDGSYVKQMGYPKMATVKTGRPIRIGKVGTNVIAESWATDGALLLCLVMIGVKEAVKASWATLAAAKNTQPLEIKGINQNEFFLDQGWKNYLTLRTKLPNGLVEWAVINKKCTNTPPRAEHFYRLAPMEESLIRYPDERPAGFYTSLDQAISIPILPQWEGYLWQEGRARNAITLANNYFVNTIAWKINSNYELWRTIVEEGIDQGSIRVPNA